MRKVRWQFVYAFLIALGLASISFAASCPLLTHDDANEQREFQNVCQQIASVAGGNLTISSTTVSTLTVTTKLTIPNGTAATDAAAFGQIKVIQSTCTTSLTSFSTTQNSFQATNNTATITPTKAANRIFVIANSKCRNNSAANSMFVTVLRGGTNVLGASGQTQLDTAGGTIEAPCSVFHMDVPNTTSSTIYAVGIRNSDSATSVSYGDSAMTQEMCLFEIAYP